MHETSPVSQFLNRLLFDPIARAMGIHLAPDHHAVPDHIVMILIIALGLISFSLWLRGKLRVDNPGRKVRHQGVTPAKPVPASVATRGRKGC